MSDSTEKPSRTKRWRYSLSTLLILMTALSVIVGWYSRSARRQRAAVEWVGELQGEVIYDYEVDASGRMRKIAIPPGPKLVRENLGIDYLDHVIAVHLSNTDGVSLLRSEVIDITPLAALDKVETLDLAECYELSDLEPLRNLTRMKWLDLSYTSVEDLSPISDMVRLETLSLSGTMVKDLRPLGGLKSLQWLDVSETEATDITPLLELRSLKNLVINEKLAESGELIEQLNTQNPGLVLQIQRD